MVVVFQDNLLATDGGARVLCTGIVTNNNVNMKIMLMTANATLNVK